MSNEVGEAKSTELATLPEGAWGAADEMTADDFLIGKALIMQALSEMVTEGEASPGQYRNSLTGELYADVDETFDAICFFRDLTWVVFEGGEYKETIPVKDENRRLPIEEGDIRRDKTFNFYLLSVNDLAENPGSAAPVILSLKRTGVRTAKAIQTFFGNLAADKKPSAAYVIRLGTKKVKGEKGTYHVATFNPGRETTKEEQLVAYKWYKTILEAKKEQKIRVHDESEIDAPGASNSDEDDDDIPF